MSLNFVFCNSGLDSKGQKIEAPKAPKSQKIEEPKAPKSQKIEAPTADKVAQNEDTSSLISNLNTEQMKALLEKVGGKAESPKEASEAGGGSSKSAQKPETKADAATEEKSDKLAQGLGQMLGGGESKKG